MSLAFTSWSFDQASYAPGATVTLTVTYSSSDLVAASDVSNAVTVVLSDSAGTVSQSSDSSGNFPSFTVAEPGTNPQPTTISASPGTWTVVSNTFAGTAAPFTGTAVLTTVAA